jgi:CRP-like cAMP-binding protein
MHDHLKSALAKLHIHSDEQIQSVAERIIQRSLRRHEILLSPPSVSNFVGLVLQGSLRMYRPASETVGENTIHFFTEGDWIADFDSFVVQQPTQHYIQAMERSELAILSIHDLHALIRQNELYMALGRIMKDWNVTANRYTSLINDSPDKRYQTLIETHPDWILRFPQMHLASYLGMTRETFSRVRKRASN